MQSKKLRYEKRMLCSRCVIQSMRTPRRAFCVGTMCAGA
jgi:hypothetical protein